MSGFLDRTVSELFKDGDSQVQFAFTPSLTVGDALDVLEHFEVFSAPVVDDNGTPLGWIDNLDLFCFLIDARANEKESNVIPRSRNLNTQDLELLTRRANDWSLSKLLKKKGNNERKFHSIRSSASLMDALVLFARGVHAMPVVNAKREVLASVSQADLISLLANDLPLLGPVAARTIAQLKLGRSQVFAVRNSDSALDAFYELHEAEKSGGAIINDEGRLVGNWSNVDLLGVQQGSNYTTLSQSVMVYQRKHRVQNAQRLVTVKADTTLGGVVSLMAREGTPRVFVVKGGMFPEALITRTDVCKVILRECRKSLGKGATKGKAAKRMERDSRAPLQFATRFPPQ